MTNDNTALTPTTPTTPLAERVAIVTGSGNGIGRAVAIGFARAGAKVVVNDVDGTGAAKTVDTIRQAGGAAEVCVCAVGSEDSAAALVDTAQHTFGGLHILVNVAGVFAPAPLTEMTAEMFDRVLRVHLYGSFFNIREAVRKAMAPQRYGKIINVTSRTGTRGYPPGECNYSAAKMGIVGMTLSLAHELKPLRINVNALSPVAWSRIAKQYTGAERAAAEVARSQNVLGRVALTEDLVPTFVFLASDASEYLTGQILQATGEPASLL